MSKQLSMFGENETTEYVSDYEDMSLANVDDMFFYYNKKKLTN